MEGSRRNGQIVSGILFAGIHNGAPGSTGGLKFRIADTFSGGLAGLTSEEQRTESSRFLCSTSASLLATTRSAGLWFRTNEGVCPTFYALSLEIPVFSHSGFEARG